MIVFSAVSAGSAGRLSLVLLSGLIGMLLSGPSVLQKTNVGVSAFSTTSIPTKRAHKEQRKNLHQLLASSTAPDSTNKDGTSGAASQNIFGLLSDSATGAAFSFLHAFDDDCGIQDSSKNLRVLWVRALLHQKGLIHDEVAQTLLPPSTRGLVTSKAGSSLFDPILKFTEWIQARTEFIDKGVQYFLDSPLCTTANGDSQPCNIVLFGAGYDTRALRFRHAHDHQARFFEVDLPEVVRGKKALYEKFQREQDPTWDREQDGSRLVPLDLNTVGNDGVSLIETLQEAGLDKSKPTFFVFEAVLFYVNAENVKNIVNELADYSATTTTSTETNESMICFTDSLKPFVDVPFTNNARTFFSKTMNMDLLEHRSRWGGAVHFCLAASRRRVQEEGASSSAQYEKGEFSKFISDKVGGLVNSYVPTQSNNKAILNKPSFENTWYAIGYPWQIDGYETPLDHVLKRRRTEGERKPFATRLWGEPIVVYRDEQGELVAMADVCPHRSVPLSMGMYNEKRGQVTCMYHGWAFGKGGDCEDVPTLHVMNDDGEVVDRNTKTYLSTINKANCGNLRAVVEHEGLVYVWRGNILEADPSLLPSRRKGDMETVPIDTVLDYNVDYSYIVENNLDSPHLFYLHDGSVPPIESIGMLNVNLPKLRLTAFTDDCGMGHLGKLGTGRPKKLIRFDPPNIVRHGGVSGFEEEFHIIPIAPQRTRVLLRQHLPRGPILSTVTSFPGLLPILTILVNNWNYHIGLEDACVMQGQANRIEDWAAPRMAVGGLGDDLIKRYWKWRTAAHDDLLKKKKDTQNGSDGLISPYFVEFSQLPKSVNGIPSGTSMGDSPQVVQRVRESSRLRNAPLVDDAQEIDPGTGNPIGSWGIKQSYLQSTPAANFPPMNYKQYKSLLVFDDFIKKLFTQKSEVCPPEQELKPPRSGGGDNGKTEHQTGVIFPLEAPGKDTVFTPGLAANQTLASG